MQGDSPQLRIISAESLPNHLRTTTDAPGTTKTNKETIRYGRTQQHIGRQRNHHPGSRPKADLPESGAGGARCLPPIPLRLRFAPLGVGAAGAGPAAPTPSGANL